MKYKIFFRNSQTIARELILLQKNYFLLFEKIFLLEKSKSKMFEKKKSLFFSKKRNHNFRTFREELGIEAECAGIYDGKWKSGNGEELTSICPINGRPIAKVKSATMAEYDQVVNAARDAFKENVKKIIFYQTFEIYLPSTISQILIINFRDNIEHFKDMAKSSSPETG